jgi:hypothetical protein
MTILVILAAAICVFLLGLFASPPKCPRCGSCKTVASRVPLDVECFNCGHRFTPCLKPKF